jgi:MFS family permease
MHILGGNSAANKTVFFLGAMSFFWGVSSSMVFTILPLYIVSTLGGTSSQFGFLEGSVLFFASLSRIFAGILVDIFKRATKMLVFGTILTIIGRICFVFAGNLFLVFLAKTIDRFSKGFRSAPTDALLATVAQKHGFAYSFKYMSNVAGSLVGAFITWKTASLLGYKTTFIIAIAPAILAYFVMVFGVKIGEHMKGSSDVPLNDKIKERKKWNINDIKILSKQYWKVIIFATILMLARFSEGFITLRLREVLPDLVEKTPIYMAIYEIFAVAFAILVSIIADKVNKNKIILIGLFILFMTDIDAIFANSFCGILLIYIGAGIHMGLTHGLLYSMIAQVSEKSIIGTAFAIYYCVEGISLFISNYIAGNSGNVVKLLGYQPSSGPFFLGVAATLAAGLYLACAGGIVTKKPQR